MRPRSTKEPIGDWRYSGRVPTVFNRYKYLDQLVSSLNSSTKKNKRQKRTYKTGGSF